MSNTNFDMEILVKFGCLLYPKHVKKLESPLKALKVTWSTSVKLFEVCTSSMTTLCIGGKVGIGYQILDKWLVKFWCLSAPKYVKSRREGPIQSSKGHLIHFCQIVLKLVGTSSNDRCTLFIWFLGRGSSRSLVRLDNIKRANHK